MARGGPGVFAAVCAVLGIGIATAGVLVAVLVIPNAVDSQVQEALVVNSKDDSSYDDWRVLDQDDPPKYKHFYLFDIENPEEVLLGEKPELKEYGPYVYRILEEKLDVEFHDGDKVTHGWDTRHYFERELSSGSDTRQITNFSPTYSGLRFALGSGTDIDNAGSELAMYTALFSGLVPVLSEGFVEQFPERAELDMFQTVLDAHRVGFDHLLSKHLLEFVVASGTQDNFFNSVAFEGGSPLVDGIAKSAGTAQAFTAPQQQAILNGPDGWLVLTPPDLRPPKSRLQRHNKATQGGIREFLDLYATGEGLDDLAAVYGVTLDQLDVLGAYATYIVDVALPLYRNGQSRDAAFQAQWATMASPANPGVGGMPLFPASSVPWELNSDLLNDAQKASLLTFSAQGEAGVPGSLLNENFELGLGLWLGALLQTEGAKELIMATHQLTEDQFSALSAYVLGQKGNTFNDFLQPLYAADGVTTKAELGAFQWGTGEVTGGARLTEQEYYAVATNPACEAFVAIPGLPTSLDKDDAEFVLGLTPEEVDAIMIAGQPLSLGTDIKRTGVVSYAACAVIGATGVEKPVFSTRTVHEWLWDYQDPILQTFSPTATQAALFSNDSTTNEPDTFNTGAKDLSKLQFFEKWQGKEEVEVWEKPETITGTNGAQFKPKVSSSDKLKAWVSDFQRVVELVHDEDTTVKGIDVLRFRLNTDLLDVSDNYRIKIKGMQDVTSIAGSPTFASKPHFLDADESVREAVKGLSPDIEKHDTTIDVEPITGAAFRVHKRLQISTNVVPSDFVYTGVAPAAVPLVWVDETGEIDDDSASDFKSKVVATLEVGTAGAMYGGIALGVVCIGAGVGRFLWVKRKGPSDTDMALSNLGY